MDVARERRGERGGDVAPDVRERAREQLEEDALGAEGLDGEREDLGEALAHLQVLVGEGIVVREEGHAADDSLVHAEREEHPGAGRVGERRAERGDRGARPGGTRWGAVVYSGGSACRRVALPA